MTIDVISYDQHKLTEQKNVDPGELKNLLTAKEIVSWINISGVGNLKTLETIGETFGIHPLVLEDIQHCWQRPRSEDFEKFLYVVLRVLSWNQQNEKINAHQLSFILVQNCVLSFNENSEDIFEPIRNRLDKNKGKIRKCGADYLLYSLLDIVVDNYFGCMEKIIEVVNDIEDDLVKNPSREMLLRIHRLKRELLFLSKSIWPLRELFSLFSHNDSHFFTDETTVYVRDIYDHTIQIIDTTESIRETVSSLLDIYLSSLSNRMNEIMKVLTIIATIFIPLTFIAGIYGMNFQYMPELKFQYGYPLTIAIMMLVAITMLAFFKKKRWLNKTLFLCFDFAEKSRRRHNRVIRITFFQLVVSIRRNVLEPFVKP
jgi:magnesium transporter